MIFAASFCKRICVKERRKMFVEVCWVNAYLFASGQCSKINTINKDTAAPSNLLLLIDTERKHCQRHNGPEGWVHLTKVTSLGHITSSGPGVCQQCGRHLLSRKRTYQVYTHCAMFYIQCTLPYGQWELWHKGFRNFASLFLHIKIFQMEI